MSTLQTIWNWIVTIWNWIVTIWNWVVAAWNWIVDAIMTVISFIQMVWSWIVAAWNWIGMAISTTISFIRMCYDWVANAIVNALQTCWDWISTICYPIALIGELMANAILAMISFVGWMIVENTFITIILSILAVRFILTPLYREYILFMRACDKLITYEQVRRNRNQYDRDISIDRKRVGAIVREREHRASLKRKEEARIRQIYTDVALQSLKKFMKVDRRKSTVIPTDQAYTIVCGSGYQ